MKKKATVENSDEASSRKKQKMCTEKQQVAKPEKVETSKTKAGTKNVGLKASQSNTKNKKSPTSAKKSNTLKGGKQAQDKPPNWNEFKKEKKELLKKRKANRSLIDVISKAKRLGEKLCVKEIKGGVAERSRLVHELHQLIGNQGNYVKFVLSHDMSRIVQYIIKYGTNDIRDAISTEILPATIPMLQSKYGKYVVRHILKYSNSHIRAKCIRSMYGNAVKLASHAVSAPIFEYAYTTFAQPEDKVSLTQEFFGDMFKHTKHPDMLHMRDVYKDAKELKVATLNAVKAHLERIINKQLLDAAIVHTVCAQFLDECSPSERADLITQLSPHIVVLSNSKDGTKAVMTCFWHATNKDRKKMLKTIKEHVGEMCVHEYAHVAIIGLLDAADDTVLVNKTIVSEILKHAQELIGDRWGRRVLMWMVAPGDTKQFHPQFVRELEAGRAASSCKKDAQLRRQEIRDVSIGPLVEKIVEAPRSWCSDVNRFLVLSAVLRCEQGREHAANAFPCIAQLLADPECKVDGQALIEHAGIHMCLKSLLKSDRDVSTQLTFGQSIFNVMNDDVISQWISVNRGCFFLLHVLENNKWMQTNVCLKLKPYLKQLRKNGASKGAELLVEHLLQNKLIANEER